MSSANTIEIKLKFLTERLDAIQAGVAEVRKLKDEALDARNVLAGGALVGLGQGLVQGMASALGEVQHVFGEVKEAIDLGGALTDLSAQTGQSVGDLVVLRQALEETGVGAEQTGAMINLLQKALTGVNEEGQPTAKSFERLGLSITELRGMSAIGQIEALSEALSGVRDPAERANVAMELFGRRGAGMLALLADTGAIDEARRHVGGMVQTYEANAEAFDRLGDSLDAMGARAVQLFSGMAAELAPALQAMADGINAADLTEAGRQIGEVIKAMAELVKLATPAAAALGALVVARKVASMVQGLTGALTASGAAIERETAALARNSTAHAANEAARRRNAAVPAAGGFTSALGSAPAAGRAPAQPTPGGASALYGDYTKFRSMGWDAQAATGAAKALGELRTQATAASGVMGKFGQMLTGARGMLNRPLGGMMAFTAAEMSVTHLAANAIPDMMAGFQLGGKTSRGDMAAAATMRATNAEQITELAERIRTAQTTDEKAAIQAEIAAQMQKAVTGQKEAGFFEEGRTARTTALSDHATALSRLMEVLSGKQGLLSPEEYQAREAAEKAKAEEDQRRETNNAWAAEQAKTAAEANRQTANETAIDASEKSGSTDAIRARIDALAALRDENAKVTDTADPRFQEAATMVKTLADEIKALEQAAGKVTEQAAEQANKKEEARLRAALELERARGQTRLAELDAAGAKESELDAAREQNLAAQLDIERQIAALHGTTAEHDALAAERRKQAALASAQAAQTAATTAADAAPSGGGDTPSLPAPGQLYPGTNHRRGAATSALHDASIDLLTPRLAATPQPTLPQQPALPQQSAPPPAASASSSSSGDSSGVAAAGEKTTAAIKALEKEAVAAMGKTTTAVDSARSAITSAIKALEQRVKSLEDGI